MKLLNIGITDIINRKTSGLKYDFTTFAANVFLSILLIIYPGNHSGLIAQIPGTAKKTSQTFQIPKEYLSEPKNIPAFWISTITEINEYLAKNVSKGTIVKIGTSAGGRPILAVFYGHQRNGKGTTTYSGSLGYGDLSAYRGPDNKKTVYMGMAGVHGGEFEGIVGIINLISVLETGKDLRGKEWPEITTIAEKVDRIILIPVVNPDGRSRVPLRMEEYRGTDFKVAEFLNTGGKPDGTLTGWPQVKKFIPVDFTLPGFPGGYPNDNGVNIQHDDFLGKRQPETQALFDIAEKEKPDLILNMHTGAVYILMHRPFAEPALSSVFDSLFTHVQSELAVNGLQNTKNHEIESNFKHAPKSVYNLDAALNMHCGALSVVIESPSHAFSGTNSSGNRAYFTPEMLLEGQLICHQEALKFLAGTGGRSVWLP
jgi:hypothetical protein